MMESQKQEKIETIVDPRDYRETTSPNDFLVAKNLDSSVGVGLVENFGDVRKRGLAYIFYNGHIVYNQDTSIGLSEANKNYASGFLKNVLIKFGNLESLGEKLENAENIDAYVVSNRFKEKQAKSEGLEVYEYINPMFDFVVQWLAQKGIEVSGDNNFQCDKESLKDDNEMHEIGYKALSLHYDKINITYLTNKNVWLNTKTYQHKL